MHSSNDPGSRQFGLLYRVGVRPLLAESRHGYLYEFRNREKSSAAIHGKTRIGTIRLEGIEHEGLGAPCTLVVDSS
jgi:hypothetical protein